MYIIGNTKTMKEEWKLKLTKKNVFFLIYTIVVIVGFAIQSQKTHKTRLCGSTEGWEDKFKLSWVQNQTRQPNKQPFKIPLFVTIVILCKQNILKKKNKKLVTFYL